MTFTGTTEPSATDHCKELVKHTDEDHPDYHNLVNTIDTMSQLVTLVNQSARESENLQKILEIERSLSRADVCPPLCSAVLAFVWRLTFAAST